MTEIDNAWLNELRVISKLENIPHGKETIKRWTSNGDHGIKHSLSVYSGSRCLAETGGLNINNALDRQLQALSVMHDMSRHAGVDWSRHAARGGAMVRKWGEAWGFSPEEIKQLSTDLAYHDLGYDLSLTSEKRATRMSRMSEAGKFFHDADKLFAVTDGSDWTKDAIEVVKRNKLGAFKDDGWYLFRKDIDNNDRDQFQYGARWWLDRLAVARLDFFFRMDPLTESGKILAQKRQTALLNNLDKVFGPEFFDHQQKIVGFDKKILARQAKEAQETILDKSPGRFTTQPKGKMLKINDQLLDPTILEYVLKEEGFEKFTNDIRQILTGETK